MEYYEKNNDVAVINRRTQQVQHKRLQRGILAYYHVKLQKLDKLFQQKPTIRRA